MNPSQIVGIVVGCAVALFLIIYFACAYIRVRPDTATRVTGFGAKKTLIGQSGIALPFFQRRDSLSLKTFQIDIKTSEAIPTKNYVRIKVDAVANIKISSDPAILDNAFQNLLSLDDAERESQVKEILQGNIREIVGTVTVEELVQNRQSIAERVKENVIPDLRKLGYEVTNFNIQSFTDGDHVLDNLAIEQVTEISKKADIARANNDKEVRIAKAAADQAANDAEVNAKTVILQKNTDLSLKESDLKIKTDTAKAKADAAYNIEKQKRQQEINTAEVDADIAKREREITLQEKEVAVTTKRLEAEINKKADAEKYKKEKDAEAEKYARTTKAEAERVEAEKQAEIKKITANAEKEAALLSAEAKKALANADRVAAEEEAEGIKAKGEAEAEAIQKKADAMKDMPEAYIMQLILDSKVLPDVVKAQAEPIAAALAKIGNITMYGDGNQAKLVSEIQQHGDQIFAGLDKTLGVDLKSVISGWLGGTLASKKQIPQSVEDPKKAK